MTSFYGDRHSVLSFLKQHGGKFYVYVLCRPDDTPFYVGKGTNRRVLDHEMEALRNHPIGEANPFKSNIIRKIYRDGGAIRYKIDSVFDPADQLKCLEREASLIAEYKRFHEGGTLSNLAGGLGNLSGAAPFSLERHAATLAGSPEDNPDRAVLNEFLLGFGHVGSVPIKPITQISRILHTLPHNNPRKPTPRTAYALLASAVAHGLALSDGVRIPRRFSYKSVEAIIENGVASDLVKAGVAELIPSQNPIDELFEMSSEQVAIVKCLVGEQVLQDRGLL